MRQFNFKKITITRIFTAALFALLFSGCAKTGKEISFAFVGDLHYSMPDSVTSDKLVKDIAGELGSLEKKPDFMVLTGDFFHGSSGIKISDEADMAFKEFTAHIGMPYYISRGNHDSRSHFERNALPIFSKELGREIKKCYYSFDQGNCHFIMIDNLDKSRDLLPEMTAWLEKDLQAASTNKKIKHIFAAAHDPLWIVARAGFNDPECATQVKTLLAKYKVDAFLCGHTHNKTVTVRKVNGQPLTQIMDAAVVEKGRLYMLAPFMNHVAPQPADLSRPGILPLEEGHMIFVPESDRDYYWGYQEGSTTSYYVFTVTDTTVQADWHVLGQGVVRSFKWSEPGKLVDLKAPQKVQKEAVTESNMQQITKAWLYAAPWIERDSVLAGVSINGVKAGTFAITRKKMAASPFWNKIELPVDEKAVKAIKLDNEIAIGNPSDVKFGISHLFLLVQFSDGRFARTNVAPKVLTSFIAEEGKYPSFPAAELVESVNSGEPLAKVSLKFDKFY
jgi:3',5'-cyclic AMP phosphodiesterase CpdA